MRYFYFFFLPPFFAALAFNISNLIANLFAVFFDLEVLLFPTPVARFAIMEQEYRNYDKSARVFTGIYNLRIVGIRFEGKEAHTEKAYIVDRREKDSHSRECVRWRDI